MHLLYNLITPVQPDKHLWKTTLNLIHLILDDSQVLAFPIENFKLAEYYLVLSLKIKSLILIQTRFEIIELTIARLPAIGIMKIGVATITIKICFIFLKIWLLGAMQSFK